MLVSAIAVAMGVAIAAFAQTPASPTPRSKTPGAELKSLDLISDLNPDIDEYDATPAEAAQRKKIMAARTAMAAGDKAYKLGHVDEAMKDYRDATNKWDGSSTAFYMLAINEQENGDLAQAADDMLSGTKIAGDGANTYFMFRCAALYLDLGDYAKAAAEYRAAAKIYNFGGTGDEPQTVQLPAPESAGASPAYLTKRLRALCETGMGNEVRGYGGVYGDENEVAHFSRAAALAPDVAEVHYFYGIGGAGRGLTAGQAIDEVRKAALIGNPIVAQAAYARLGLAPWPTLPPAIAASSASAAPAL
jgi:tetratricopeptide (TPR) repeat protein